MIWAIYENVNELTKATVFGTKKECKEYAERKRLVEKDLYFNERVTYKTLNLVKGECVIQKQMYFRQW